MAVISARKIFLSVITCLSLLLVVAGCSDDGALLISQNGGLNANPGGGSGGGGGNNGGGGGGTPPTLTCFTSMTLTATFTKKPSPVRLDQTFYMLSNDARFSLQTSPNCPRWVDQHVQFLRLGIGRYIGPAPIFPAPQAFADLARGETPATDVASARRQPWVDYFGLSFDEALFFGTATTLSQDRIGFTMSIPQGPSYANPACAIGFEFSNGLFEKVPAIVSDTTVNAADVDLAAPTVEVFNLRADVAISLSHASDVNTCAGLYVTKDFRLQ